MDHEQYKGPFKIQFWKKKNVENFLGKYSMDLI